MTTRARIGVCLVALALVSVACSRESTTGGTTHTGSTAQVDQVAPGFTLEDSAGDRVSLSTFKRHRPVLLYFSMGPG
jgi:cytochrome oxidase Cu insertion factor (SCO1/SenC/PrrC family)